MKAPLLLAATALAATTLAACAPTYLASIPPVCARPEVMAFLNARLHRTDPYAETIPATATERPATPGRVACTVQVRQITFDTPRLGPTPAVALATLPYTVREAAGGGLVVDMAP